jgi:xylulose-5-phosphate/fructose-6-phosphate phosphoketolase
LYEVSFPYFELFCSGQLPDVLNTYTSDDELVALFTGYGYQCRIVGTDLDKVQLDMAASLEWAHDTIRKIQKAARSGNPIYKPRWPMLILRTPKGWTGPKESHGQRIEGTFHAHQVPLPAAKKDEEQLGILEKWLKSYKPEELFSENYTPKQDLIDLFPDDSLKMGMRKETYGNYHPLDLAEWQDFSIQDEEASPMKQAGKYLADVIKRNPKAFRIFCPDEMTSNKLDAVFDVSKRVFEWDKDIFAQKGRVLEILSEHTCQGLMQGYTLTGRTALFPSYEA